MLINAMSEPTPMMMPSAVSAERSLFRPSACNAILVALKTVMVSRQGRLGMLPAAKLLAAVEAFGDGPVLQDPSVADEDIAPGIARDVQFVRHHDNGDAALVERLQYGHD